MTAPIPRRDETTATSVGDGIGAARAFGQSAPGATSSTCAAIGVVEKRATIIVNIIGIIAADGD